MKTNLKALVAVSSVLMTIGLIANVEAVAGRAHAQEVVAAAPLKVTMYEGHDCVSPSGQFEETVLTNDDADPRLQKCSWVQWKELRRE